MAQTCNPYIWEAEVGGSQIQGQSELHSKAFSQQKAKKGLKVSTLFQEKQDINMNNFQFSNANMALRCLRPCQTKVLGSAIVTR